MATAISCWDCCAQFTDMTFKILAVASIVTGLVAVAVFAGIAAVATTNPLTSLVLSGVIGGAVSSIPLTLLAAKCTYMLEFSNPTMQSFFGSLGFFLATTMILIAFAMTCLIVAILIVSPLFL